MPGSRAAMFTQDDARWLSEAVKEIYAAPTETELAGAAQRVLHDQFRLHSFAFEELGAGGSFYRVHGLRCAVPPPAGHAAHFHDNPFGWVIGAPAPPPVLHIRSDVSVASWHATDHFNGIARPMGWQDQVIMVADSRPNLVSVGVYRDTAFRSLERELFGLLQPHLAAAWRRLRTIPPRESLPLRIALAGDLQPQSMDAAVRGVLRSYFPGWRPSEGLPGQLRDWARHAHRRLQASPLLQPLHAFTIESGRGRLAAHLYSGRETAEIRLIEEPSDPDFLRLQHRGLSARECEILHWIAQGKRDAEIAAVVGAAPRTVSKHVENILRKLGTETRTAAVATAREWLA